MVFNYCRAHPILDTRISRLCSEFVTPVLPPLDSETGWTGELWSKTNLLILQNYKIIISLKIKLKILQINFLKIFNSFLHFIQVKHILYDFPCKKTFEENTCQLCGRVFKTKCDIRKHLKIEHNFFLLFLLKYILILELFHFGVWVLILLGSRNNPWH